MKIRHIIFGFCFFIIFSCLIWLIAFWYLIHQEDYSPKPGSIIYYIGISSLVRNAPISGAIAQPEYFGSVGDGNKPPQSEMSFIENEQNAKKSIDALTNYLHQKSFQQRPITTNKEKFATSLIPEGEHLYSYTEYVSSSGEVALLTMTKVEAGNHYRVTITHYH